MITKEELNKIARTSGLPLYQQEKDYLLKLFLYNYYRTFDEAIFKGGTCLKYLSGLNRFSEDLDFNIKNPKKFEKEVKHTLEQIKLLGISFEIKKEEIFKAAYTSEIIFKGPLFNGKSTSLNKFRIDAGYRLGTMTKPVWGLIRSEYPETPENFLVKTMSEEEMLAEKIVAIFQREKGRDLFDAWFLLKKGVQIKKALLKKKMEKIGMKKLDLNRIISKKGYLKDMEKLAKQIVPYEQIARELKEKLKALRSNI